MDKDKTKYNRKRIQKEDAFGIYYTEELYEHLDTSGDLDYLDFVDPLNE